MTVDIFGIPEWKINRNFLKNHSILRVNQSEDFLPTFIRLDLILKYQAEFRITCSRYSGEKSLKMLSAIKLEINMSEFS